MFHWALLVDPSDAIVYVNPVVKLPTEIAVANCIGETESNVISLRKYMLAHLLALIKAFGRIITRLISSPTRETFSETRNG